MDIGNIVSIKAKRWAYTISFLFPPFGILIAFYFFYQSEQDSNRVAWICIVITVLVMLLLWLFFNILLSGSGVSLDDIRQIDPDELRDLLK